MQDSLLNSNYYRFWVVARNDAGISDRSVTLTVLSAIETSEPLVLSTTYQDEYRVALEWNQPEANNGSPAHEYWLEMLEDSTWTLIDVTPQTSYSVTVGIQTGESYVFRVMAMNEIGLSAPSDELTIIAT
jgi:hypothetical protein